jgi:uncharacterized membrane protein YesL
MAPEEAPEEAQEEHGRTLRATIFEVMEAGGIFIMANLLWVVCSLPLITMPAATAGLFAVFVPWARGQTVEPLSMFFSGIRHYGWRGTAVFLLDLIVGSLVVLNLLILPQMGLSQVLMGLVLATTLLSAALALMTNVYIWPLLILQDWPLSTLLPNALRLALTHPGWTLLVAGTAVMPLLFSFFLPQIVFVTLTFSTCALITSWGAWRVIQRYLRS